MTTLPEEAVKAAARELCRFGTNFSTIEATKSWVDEKWPRFKEEATRALTAALPFLPVRGAVKKLEWRKYRNGDAETVTPFGEIYTAYVNGYWRITRNGKAGKFIKATGGDDVEAAKAGAQADFDTNVLSLVRSQAVELLAAERMESEELRRAIMGKEPAPDLQHGNFLEMAATLHRACDGTRNRAEYAEQRLGQSEAELKQVRADNAAKDARVTELEDMLLKCQKRYERRVVALEAKLAAAEKALEAIEDHAARCFSLSTHSTIALAYLQDIQDEARAALGGKPSC